VNLTALSDWFAKNRRDLPWRSPDTTAWGVLVSEVMLQQTPVARVEPVWARWMEHWSTPQALGDSSAAEAVRWWGKLGYPRRARNLQRAAVDITQRFGGEVPHRVDDLLSLPGVGHYTARAVACFAFGQRHPVADTNVTRVIARVDQGLAFGSHWSTTRGMAMVESTLKDVDDGDYPNMNLAIMELGALVCRARSPRCDDCPLMAECAWREAGFPLDTAVMPKKQAPYAGSDREARGRLLEVLRNRSEPVGLSELLAAHSPASQARRALDSLLADGLVSEDDPDEEPMFVLGDGR